MIIFGWQVPDIVVNMALPLVLIVAGYLQGYKMGEKLRWTELIKSILLILVTSGVISASQMDVVLELAVTEAIFIPLDKLLNQFIRKYPLDLRSDAKPVPI